MELSKLSLQRIPLRIAVMRMRIRTQLIESLSRLLSAKEMMKMAMKITTKMTASSRLLVSSVQLLDLVEQSDSPKRCRSQKPKKPSEGEAPER